MEDDWTEEERAAIRTYCCPQNITDEDFNYFLLQARRLKLSPLARQIYCVYRGKKLSVEPTIDGLTLIAERTGEYAGVDAPDFKKSAREDWRPATATVTVYRIVQGQRCPFSWLVRWQEYAPYHRDYTTNEEKLGQMWSKMPYGQLAKCAFAAALRKAFPNELSGSYIKEEMEQAGEDAPAPQTPSQSQRDGSKAAAEDRRHPLPLTRNEDFGVVEEKPAPLPDPKDREEAKRLMQETYAKAEAERRAQEHTAVMTEKGIEVRPPTGEQLREEMKQQKKEEKTPTHEEQFAAVAEMLGMKWFGMQPGSRRKWVLTLHNAAEDKEVPEVLTNTQFLTMYNHLHNYCLATEGIPYWFTKEGIMVLWNDVYRGKVPFPKTLYHLGGSDWRQLTAALKYRNALTARRGEFFTVAHECGLWDLTGKNKLEEEAIAKNMRGWMSEKLDKEIRTRKTLTPEEWGKLTNILRQEYNTRLSHNAEPLTPEEEAGVDSADAPYQEELAQSDFNNRTKTRR